MKNLFEERAILKKSFVCFWSCKVCYKLGWNLPECNSEVRDKVDCGEVVYKNLEKHFLSFAHGEKEF